MYIGLFVCTGIYIYRFIYTYTHIYIYTYVCVYIYVHIYIYIHTHIFCLLTIISHLKTSPKPATQVDQKLAFRGLTLVGPVLVTSALPLLDHALLQRLCTEFN